MKKQPKLKPIDSHSKILLAEEIHKAALSLHLTMSTLRDFAEGNAGIEMVATCLKIVESAFFNLFSLLETMEQKATKTKTTMKKKK